MTLSNVTASTHAAAPLPPELPSGAVTLEVVEDRFTPPEIERMFPGARLTEEYLRAACDRTVAALPCIRNGKRRLIALSTLNRWLLEEEVRNV